jgi:hypothetical protein
VDDVGGLAATGHLGHWNEENCFGPLRHFAVGAVTTILFHQTTS